MLWGRETIFRDGERVGWLSSAGFGHTIGRGRRPRLRARAPRASTRDFVRAGRYELEVASERHPAEVHLAPLHDPAGSRVKA